MHTILTTRNRYQNFVELAGAFIELIEWWGRYTFRIPLKKVAEEATALKKQDTSKLV